MLYEYEIRKYVGRTLHECVDWNSQLVEIQQKLAVALYTSAWIEI